MEAPVVVHSQRRKATFAYVLPEIPTLYRSVTGVPIDSLKFSLLKMVLFFTSNGDLVLIICTYLPSSLLLSVVEPHAVIYMGRDKVESQSSSQPK